MRCDGGGGAHDPIKRAGGLIQSQPGGALVRTGAITGQSIILYFNYRDDLNKECGRGDNQAGPATVEPGTSPGACVCPRYRKQCPQQKKHKHIVVHIGSACCLHYFFISPKIVNEPTFD